MASLVTNVSMCSMCEKAMGNFTCRGCQKSFCNSHVTQHRQDLSKTMDECMLEHDQLRQSLSECTNRPCSHPFIKQIDEWELRSIDMIHQTADETRNQYYNVIGKFKNQISKVLESVTQELTKFREDDTFVDSDLSAWKIKLEKLTNDLNAPPSLSITKDYDDKSYINKLVIIETVDDIFEESVGNISITNNGKLATHGVLPSYGAVRGKGEYSLGYYKFYFKLESGEQDIFFGIMSKTASLQSNPSFARTTYGWAEDNSVFLNGIKHEKYKNYKSDMKTNDIFELLISCDQQLIRLKNKRTNEVHQLSVNVNLCPFPWQLNFSLGYWRDRVRLLSI
jgi:hypothetical protein